MDAAARVVGVGRGVLAGPRAVDLDLHAVESPDAALEDAVGEAPEARGQLAEHATVALLPRRDRLRQLQRERRLLQDRKAHPEPRAVEGGPGHAPLVVEVVVRPAAQPAQRDRQLDLGRDDSQIADAAVAARRVGDVVLDQAEEVVEGRGVEPVLEPELVVAHEVAHLGEVDLPLELPHGCGRASGRGARERQLGRLVFAARRLAAAPEVVQLHQARESTADRAAQRPSSPGTRDSAGTDVAWEEHPGQQGWVQLRAAGMLHEEHEGERAHEPVGPHEQSRAGRTVRTVAVRARQLLRSSSTQSSTIVDPCWNLPRRVQAKQPESSAISSNSAKSSTIGDDLP